MKNEDIKLSIWHLSLLRFEARNVYVPLHFTAPSNGDYDSTNYSRNLIEIPKFRILTTLLNRIDLDYFEVIVFFSLRYLL